MHLHFIPILFAQMTMPGDVVRESARLQRNYEFLSYGLIAAWLIVVVYVLFLVGRSQRIKREIASLKAMLADRHKP
jgi:CcmD family protein